MPQRLGEIVGAVISAATLAILLYIQRLREDERAAQEKLRKSEEAMQEAQKLRQATDELKRERELRKKEIAQLSKMARAASGGGGSSSSVGDTFLRLNRLLLKEDSAWDVSSSREFVREAQRVLGDAHAWLDEKQEAGEPTSRTGYLESLQEQIGPPPDKPHTWRDEWDMMTKEWLLGRKDGNAWEAAQEMEKEKLSTLLEKPQYKRDMRKLIDDMGWKASHAEAWVMLGLRRDVIAKALRERRSCFAAATYALSEALADALMLAESPSSARGGVKRIPPPVYRHLLGKHSLSATDPQWEHIESPDRTGFQGLTSSALTRASCGPAFFSSEGFREVVDKKDLSVEYQHRDSPVVRFDSQEKTDLGNHSAIVYVRNERQTSGAFPPNTLFRLKEVLQPGEWKVEGCAVGEGVEHGTRTVWPNQKLLVVTATHRPPLELGGLENSSNNKWATMARTLSYATRDAFIRGLDDILAKPVLTLSQEFDREMEWTDWRGTRYNLRDEWAYVNGPATPQKDCTPGERDPDNGGMLPGHFRFRVNFKIMCRRARGIASLPERGAYLTDEEVLAVRLYSGPAFQPINEFLRQIAWLTGSYRCQLAKHAGLTFTATILHLCRAIRKLAAITMPHETRRPLYRAVRGELPRTFWVKDALGMVTAVETGFMSTSSRACVAIGYMQNADAGNNVLWELTPKTESDSGFHRGADISLLSQFSTEAETLFPPCTMLSVIEQESYEQFKAVNSAPRSTSPAPGGGAAVGKSEEQDVERGGADSDPEQSRGPSLIPTPIIPRRAHSYSTTSIEGVTPVRKRKRARSRWHKLMYDHVKQADTASAERASVEVKQYESVKVLPTFV